MASWQIFLKIGSCEHHTKYQTASWHDTSARLWKSCIIYVFCHATVLECGRRDVLQVANIMISAMVTQKYYTTLCFLSCSRNHDKLPSCSASGSVPCIFQLDLDGIYNLAPNSHLQNHLHHLHHDMYYSSSQIYFTECPCQSFSALQSFRVHYVVGWQKGPFSNDIVFPFPSCSVQFLQMHSEYATHDAASWKQATLAEWGTLTSVEFEEASVVQW